MTRIQQKLHYTNFAILESFTSLLRYVAEIYARLSEEYKVARSKRKEFSETQ
jgi:hypothetical protein